jgi:alpha-tubulin suppressor-like RCC1 family protein
VKFKEVYASQYSLGIDTEGKLYQWGNIYSTPTHIRTEKRFLTVDEGSRHSIGLEESGTLFTWGSSEYGQLGIGLKTLHSYSAQINTSIKYKSVSAGEFYSMAIDESGTIWAWGFNAFGQFGSGVAAGALSPIKIESNVKFVSISTGNNNTLAVDESGQLWSCGSNQYGLLGIGTYGEKSSPVQITSDVNFVQMSSSKDISFAIDDKNNLWGWGCGYFASLGTEVYANYSKPVLIKPESKFRWISSKYLNTFAIDDVGLLWGWGANNYGQLGDGTRIARSGPVPIKPDTKFLLVSAGQYFTLAIDSMENLWAWGINAAGAFGKKFDGLSHSDTPQLIETKTKFHMLATGAEHALAIDSLGYLWAWGNNVYGQVGDSTRIHRSSPVSILPNKKFIAIAAGEFHSLAIDEEGILYAWGWNSLRQLGFDTDNLYSLSPLPVMTNTKFKSVSVSVGSDLAIDEEGNLWMWGLDYNENLNQAYAKLPHIILPGIKFKLISAGNEHFIAIDETEKKWVWGRYQYGQLGTGDAFSEHFIKLNDVHFVPVSWFNTFPQSLDLELDSVAQITIKIVPTNATDQRIEWTSSNESVASVDSLGYVKAVGVGFATIRAKSVDLGQTRQVSVYVIKKTIPDAVDDVDNNQVLMVYPNPVSNGEVSVRLSNNDEKAQMSLYNSIGQKVASGTMEAGEIGRIDCRTLRSGIYILNVSTPSRQMKQSICIQ